MRLVEKKEIGGVSASLYLERIGYTYKIRAYIKGHKTKQVVARSYIYYARKEDAKDDMTKDLYNITKQLELF